MFLGPSQDGSVLLEAKLASTKWSFVGTKNNDKIMICLALEYTWDFKIGQFSPQISQTLIIQS